MKPGFRQQKQKSAKHQIRDLATTVQNLQMAVRVLQMGLQQIGQSFQKMDADISNSIGVINDLQYRTLAMMDVGDFDKDKLEKVAAEFKLDDYNKASDKEDKARGYTTADVIKEDSIVILTSTCKEDKSRSIFRTKFKLSESGNPEAQEKLKGLKVGEKAELKLAGLTHEVTVLGVRTAPAPKPKAEPKPEAKKEAAQPAPKKKEEPKADKTAAAQ